MMVLILSEHLTVLKVQKIIDKNPIKSIRDIAKDHKVSEEM